MCGRQIVLGVGVTYAAVPLYRMFCAATGFAGTPKVGMGKFEADRLVPVENAKRIKVHFNADTSDALPWSFTPEQKFVSVLPGETSLAFYKAKNKSDKDIIGIATYNVTPDRVRPCSFFIVRQIHSLKSPDCSVLRQGGMLLLRGAEIARRRGS